MTTAIVGGLIITTLLLIGEKLSKKKKNSNILKNYGMMIHEYIRFRRSLNILLKYKIDILDYITRKFDFRTYLLGV